MSAESAIPVFPLTIPTRFKTYAHLVPPELLVLSECRLFCAQ